MYFSITDLVDACTVVFAHAAVRGEGGRDDQSNASTVPAELINAAQATISKHKRTCLKRPLTRVLVMSKQVRRKASK